MSFLRPYFWDRFSSERVSGESTTTDERVMDSGDEMLCHALPGDVKSGLFTRHRGNATRDASATYTSSATPNPNSTQATTPLSSWTHTRVFMAAAAPCPGTLTHTCTIAAPSRCLSPPAGPLSPSDHLFPKALCSYWCEENGGE